MDGGERQPRDPERIELFRMLRGVMGVAFGPDGDLLAVADGNGCTYPWQMTPRAT